MGIPVLAEGATAFGLLMSAYAGGSLWGYVLAGGLWTVYNLYLQSSEDLLIEQEQASS